MRMSTLADGTPLITKEGLHEVYTLEVNAQCGISTGRDTAVSWIMEFNNLEITDLIMHILYEGVRNKEMRTNNRCKE